MERQFPAIAEEKALTPRRAAVGLSGKRTGQERGFNAEKKEEKWEVRGFKCLGG